MFCLKSVATDEKKRSLRITRFILNKLELINHRKETKLYLDVVHQTNPFRSNLENSSDQINPLSPQIYFNERCGEIFFCLWNNLENIFTQSNVTFSNNPNEKTIIDVWIKSLSIFPWDVRYLDRSNFLSNTMRTLKIKRKKTIVFLLVIPLRNAVAIRQWKPTWFSSHRSTGFVSSRRRISKEWSFLLARKLCPLVSRSTCLYPPEKSVERSAKSYWQSRDPTSHIHRFCSVAQDRSSRGFPFISYRVPESLTIHDLRRYIIDTCSDANEFPGDFLYLRSVGRCLTKVKLSQEKELKIKHYRPPMVSANITDIFSLQSEIDLLF